MTNVIGRDILLSITERVLTPRQEQALNIVEGFGGEPQDPQFQRMSPVRRARVLLEQEPDELKSIKHTLLAGAYAEAAEQKGEWARSGNPLKILGALPVGLYDIAQALTHLALSRRENRSTIAPRR